MAGITPHNPVDASRPAATWRIAIAAGGTGGHVMPALALAEALRREDPGGEILFFSGRREQEIKWYARAGWEPEQLPAVPLGRGLGGKARGVWRAWQSFRQAKQTLRRQPADCLVGMGSYIAGPCVLAALRLGIPTVIHEQNSVAGKTNRWLANRVDVVATTYPDAFAGIPTRRLAVVGNPIRPGFLEETPRAEARRSFDLDPKRPTLLVYGGSQGAEKINEAVIGLLARKTGDEDDPWQALWITGARAHERFKGRLEGLAGADMVRLVPFVEDMNRAYSAADLVLCRAGSASLAEASAWERPMIAVPFPWAADDHQRRNAAFFAESGACRVLEEQDLTPESLGRAVDSILGSPDLRGKMAEASADLARPEAAAELARLVLDTAGRARNASNSS